MRARPALVGALVAVAALVTTSCSGTTPTPLPSEASASATPSPASSATTTCGNALQSYTPPATLPAPDDLQAGSTMAAIRKRGRLIAGVSADTYLLSARNPLTGRIEGFDIDIVDAIAAAILGKNPRVELRVITAAQRQQVLQDHSVDVVVRAYSMTCDRWKDVAFSAEYYHAGQTILIRKGSAITGLSSLAGRRVCVPAGTSSETTIRHLAPKAVVVTATTHTGCLVDLQQGTVEAISGDDTVLAGLAAQDPYAVVLDEKPFTSEPYGVGIPKDHVDMVRFVNAVLARMGKDGAWTRSYDRWLAPTLGGGAEQPTPQYGRSS